MVLGSSTENLSIIGDAQPQYHSSGSHGKELLNLKRIRLQESIGTLKKKKIWFIS